MEELREDMQNAREILGGLVHISAVLLSPSLIHTVTLYLARKSWVRVQLKSRHSLYGIVIINFLSPVDTYVCERVILFTYLRIFIYKHIGRYTHVLHTHMYI